MMMSRLACHAIPWTSLLALSSGCYESSLGDGDFARDTTEDVADRPEDHAGADSDGDADADADSDGDADDGRDAHDDGPTVEECPPVSFPAGRTELRLTHLGITAPAAMRNVILQTLIDDSMEYEDFIWLLKFDGLGSGTLVLTTGAGAKVPGTTCTYQFLAPAYPPDSMTMVETGDDFDLSREPIARLDVPMWAEGTAYPEPPLLILPLRELSIEGTFNADHLGIGSYDGATGVWRDSGTLVGKITVYDAKATVIDVLGMTLCGLISRAVGIPGDPSDDCQGDPATWPNPPDTSVGSEPAYNTSGSISATAVHILP
jgi:hypothetical protein